MELEKKWKGHFQQKLRMRINFGISQEGLEELKETQAIILNAIKRPRLVLESAAFVWMVKTENE